MKKLKSYRNGNYSVILFDNGTKVRIGKDKFMPAFPENIDMKISDRCPIKCKFCHEGSTVDGPLADLNKWTPFLETLHSGTELALGGGAISSLPEGDLQNFLTKLSSRGVIVNMTINQKELENERFFNIITEYLQHKLVFGLGISFSNKSTKLESLIKKFRERVVVHVINGIVTEDTIKYLGSLNSKILILGYKNFRRGIDYFEEYQKIIKNNQLYIKNNILDITKMFKTVSFDCLAVEQLELKSIIDDNLWNKVYMGDDGSFTMYIDLVSETYGVNSTAPLEERFKLKPDDDIKYIFNRIRGK